MILTPHLLDTLGRCPRRLAFEREHEPRTISLTGLLYSAIEGSLIAPDPEQGARDAIMERMQWMDVNAGDLSPNSAVRHVECLAEVIALELRSKFGRAKRLEPIAIGEHEWQSNLFECRGRLHRFILVSHIDDDTLRSYSHSWKTIGEMAALERSMVLTAVIVGAQRGGRRYSPWVKGFVHPIQKQLRVGRRKAGGADGFTTGWKEVWRDQTDIKGETWLARMQDDEVMGDLIASKFLKFNGDDARMIQARGEILLLAHQAQTAESTGPMRRSSCDEIGRGPCPWQACCYSPRPSAPEDYPNLYRIRTPDAALAAKT